MLEHYVTIFDRCSSLKGSLIIEYEYNFQCSAHLPDKKDT